MNPVQVTLVFQEETSPKILERYDALREEDGNLLRTKFEQEIYRRLEDSFDLQEQITNLHAQVESYQEYIYELLSRLKTLDSMQSGIEEILTEVRALRRAEKSEHPSDVPKQHAKPSLAIRTLKRLREQQEKQENLSKNGTEDRNQ